MNCRTRNWSAAIGMLYLLFIPVGGAAFSPPIMPTQDRPSLGELVQTLEKYHQAFHGISYKPEYSVVGMGRTNDDETIWVSVDGNVVKSEGLDVDGRGDRLGRPGRRLGELASRKEGWCFSVSAAMDGRKGMTVTFYEKGSSAPLTAVAPSAGYFGYTTGAEYARESKTSIARQEMKGIQYWALVCDHPEGATITFLFDDDLRQIYTVTHVQAGDKAGPLDARLVKPMVAPSGVWSKNIAGPIEYVEFDGRLLPGRIPYERSGVYPGMDADDFPSGEVVYKNYALLTEKLTTRIEFSNLELPDPKDLEDGKVTSQGEHHIRYEVHDGKLVKITDTQAVDAANRARMRSGSGRWYGIMGLVFLAAVAVLVWHRRRNQ